MRSTMSISVTLYFLDYIAVMNYKLVYKKLHKKNKKKIDKRTLIMTLLNKN